jgi:hypothetical protein
MINFCFELELDISSNVSIQGLGLKVLIIKSS